MIIYFAIKHFYIKYLTKNNDNLYVLTYNNNIWDFSPELKKYEINLKSSIKNIQQNFPETIVLPIKIKNFTQYNQELIASCRLWTDQIEIEYPHAWYCQLPKNLSCENFAANLQNKLQSQNLSMIWGAAPSKILAKISAHTNSNTINTKEVPQFLFQLPIKWLQLPETKTLIKLGVHTVGELQKIPLAELRRNFGNRSEAIYKLTRGEDINPFISEDFTEFIWEKDFLLDPLVQSPINSKQLLNYFNKASISLCSQLQNNHLKASQLTIILKSESNNQQFNQKLITPTNQPSILTRRLSPIVPKQPITKVSIKITQTENVLPKQLEFEDRYNCKIKMLRTCMDDYLSDIYLPRREKILAMWEKNHL